MARIAVINDDTTFLSLMHSLLQEKGWDTVILKESSKAYEQIKKDPPDLIILDIRMESQESGWTVLELIKLDPATNSVPIIVCSAAVDDLRSREPWLMHHGIVTLPKPFDIDDLYRRVEAALR
jgi:DNA-binding response OmpR family regulator